MNDDRIQKTGDGNSEWLELMKSVMAPLIEMETRLERVEMMLKKTDAVLGKFREAKVAAKPFLSILKEDRKALYELYEETNTNMLMLGGTLNRVLLDGAELAKENEQLKKQVREMADSKPQSGTEQPDDSEARVRDEYATRLQEALRARISDLSRFGSTTEIGHLLDMLRITFYRIPEMMDAVEAEIKNLQPVQQGMTVNVAVQNGGTAQISEKEIINKPQ